MSVIDTVNLGTADDVSRKISNTEVSTWNACKRQYYYNFVLNLEPKVMNSALGRGILFHEVMGAYYQFLKAWDEENPNDYKAAPSMRHVQAVQTARSHMLEFCKGPAYDFDSIMTVDRLLTGYWDFYQGDPEWEIIAVEEAYDVPVGDHTFSFRVDLIARERKSKKMILIDHKTAYNFWNADKLALSPQFPKYKAALAKLGILIDECMLNQVRSRELKTPTATDLFRRTTVKPTKAKQDNAEREQVVASREILAYRALPLAVQEQRATRVLNEGVCKYCDAKPLCLTEWDGGDATIMLNRDYQPRTYGYNDIEVDVS